MLFAHSNIVIFMDGHLNKLPEFEFLSQGIIL